MNTNMKISNVQLIDLPDELLLMIFKNLNNVQLLYSLMGINIRLDRTISDSIFTKDLTLFTYFSNDHIYPLVDTILDRFCLQILPEIHYKINMLNLESLSLERILLATDYPNLYRLGLYNVDRKTAERVFSDESPLLDIFNKKIQSLVITLTNKQKERSKENSITSIFTNILTMFTNLRYLNCDPFSELRQSRLWFKEKIPTFFSSTLMELHIKVVGIDECLYLLDGRLNQLHTFDVNIEFIDSMSLILNQKEPLPNMKCFQLTCKNEIHYYKKSTVPLLQRMINLEKLVLFICINQQTVLDGNSLKNDIINHLPRLNKFIYNIRSLFRATDQTDLPSNEDIQRTLIGLRENQVISYVDYFPDERNGQCHYYSYPYTLKYYDNISNKFPDGLFKCVRQVSLFDERPFEYEFFVRISQAFPLLEILTLSNRKAQQQKLINNNKDLPIMEYPHLTELDFNCAHNDYIEQFLMNTKTSLPNNIDFWCDYDPLKRVTDNFTRVTTRANCAKIKCLHFYDGFQISKRLINYFPYAKITNL